MMSKNTPSDRLARYEQLFHDLHARLLRNPIKTFVVLILIVILIVLKGFIYNIGVALLTIVFGVETTSGISIQSSNSILQTGSHSSVTQNITQSFTEQEEPDFSYKMVDEKYENGMYKSKFLLTLVARPPTDGEFKGVFTVSPYCGLPELVPDTGDIHSDKGMRNVWEYSSTCTYKSTMKDEEGLFDFHIHSDF